MGVRIRGRYGDATAKELWAFLGVTQLPREGMAEREIQGVPVYVRPLGLNDRRRNWCGLRVMAICTCGRHVPVGRLHQHRC
jgi:hypothetical protein